MRGHQQLSCMPVNGTNEVVVVAVCRLGSGDLVLFLLHFAYMVSCPCLLAHQLQLAAFDLDHQPAHTAPSNVLQPSGSLASRLCSIVMHFSSPPCVPIARSFSVSDPHTGLHQTSGHQRYPHICMNAKTPCFRFWQINTSFHLL